MKKWAIAAIPFLVVAAAAAVMVLRERETEYDAFPRSFYGSDIICSLEFGSGKDSTGGWAAGYLYEILKIFAEDFDAQLSVVTPPGGESYLDSLVNGSVNLLIVPMSFQFDKDSVLCSEALDNVAYWLVPRPDKIRHKETDEWIKRFNESESASTMRARFFTNFHDPFNIARLERTCRSLSPYDSLFKHYAPLVGWDWHLLAAVAYQESRFHIEAKSGKGAEGLMQLMGDASARFGVDDMLDPEQNIKAATSYLSRLQRMFSKYVNDSEDLHKFALAAYNAGEGHILDCIHYAGYRDTVCASWDDLKSIMPALGEEDILQVDTVKLGRFNVGQTLNYVGKVYELYDVFNEICP